MSIIKPILSVANVKYQVYIATYIKLANYPKVQQMIMLVSHIGS